MLDMMNYVWILDSNRLDHHHLGDSDDLQMQTSLRRAFWVCVRHLCVNFQQKQLEYVLK